MPSSSSTLRTNSLAFAKTDCHTCASHQRSCDRKRPRCSTCYGKNILCGGYPMQLTWLRSEPKQPKTKLPVNLEDDPFCIEPLSRQTSNHAQNVPSRSLYRRYQKLAFVTENPPALKERHVPTSDSRKRKESTSCEILPRPRCQRRSISRATPSHESLLGNPLLMTGSVGVFGATKPILRNEYSDRSSPSSLAKPDELSLHSHSQMILSPPDPAGHGETKLDSEGDNYCISPILENRVKTRFIDPRLLTALRSPVLYEDLFDKFEPLLNMYNQDFCIIPLSRDILSNPLRCHLKSCRESRSLLHAVLAISYYHAGRRTNKNGIPAADVTDHHNTAEKLYHKARDTSAGLQEGMRLLDTAMILLLLRATQSALSDWSTQISNAGKLLELCGGPVFWANNRRTQAQVVLLLWWDANIALLSRQGCILPFSYFESLLALENDKYWSFFDLVGCPRELIFHLMQLTSLARENEQALSMRWTKFDLTPVNNIQASIANWKNNNILMISNNISEELIQQQRDRYHCTEAWRYGLLIYITRVFYWPRESTPPNTLTIYARLLFEHVQSCRRTSIVAKQAFFPLFLAGCETKDLFLRQSIRDFCEHWDAASGYDLFRSALSLLEDIWREQDGASDDVVWWGSVMDKKQQIYQLQEGRMQYCFG